MSSDARPEPPAPDRPPAEQPPGSPPSSPASGEVILPPARTGPELARAVLDAANARRTAAGRRGGGTGAGAGTRGSTSKAGRAASRRGWTGPGPDPRDPQPLGAVLGKLVKNRGWQRPAAEAAVFGQWEKVVGAEVAEHCRPVKLENRELTIEAVSTAWATQLRLLAGSLIKQIASVVGHNVVTTLRIHGPAAPSWKKGTRRVRGRGPRDTYG
ncbi:MAG: DUF721 domain-containing protein [Micromonosporaceae bacterium]|nr:DUF721 domain-containing protein [Micromonosporaceae bacterium]